MLERVQRKVTKICSELRNLSCKRLETVWLRERQLKYFIHWMVSNILIRPEFLLK